jgi:putative copper export protein
MVRTTMKKFGQLLLALLAIFVLLLTILYLYGRYAKKSEAKAKKTVAICGQTVSPPHRGKP